MTDNRTSVNATAALPLAAFCDAVGSNNPTPGGGAVAAVTAAMAASLAQMAARYAARAAQTPTESGELVQRTLDLQTLLLHLADEDAAAYLRYLNATRTPRVPNPQVRQDAIRAALSTAADVPLAVARSAAEVGSIAERLATIGNPRLISDTHTAAALAAAAATSAAGFVAGNLQATPNDPRIAAATESASSAAATATRIGTALRSPNQGDPT